MALHTRRWGRRGGWRGRRGTWRHPPSFYVAGVVFGNIDFRFAWQAWHLWHWTGSGNAFGFRRGAGDVAAVGVAGVALGDIHLGFMWQAWYLVISIYILRGRRGTGLHSHVMYSLMTLHATYS